VPHERRALIDQLRALTQQRYSSVVIHNYWRSAEHFLEYLAQRDIAVDAMEYRDYAILLLLSTYRLRDGEITRLRLEDIDWRAEKLYIRHSKTGASSQAFMPTWCYS
jgi:integrase